jgi:hypothetical protein
MDIKEDVNVSAVHFSGYIATSTRWILYAVSIIGILNEVFIQHDPFAAIPWALIAVLSWLYILENKQFGNFASVSQEQQEVAMYMFVNFREASMAYSKGKDLDFSSQVRLEELLEGTVNSDKVARAVLAGNHVMLTPFTYSVDGEDI